MAYTTLFTVLDKKLGPISARRKVYNFSFPVSTFSGGMKSDVMLLQALFRMLYYEFTGLGGIPAPAASTGIIKVDGIVGQQTRIHIQHFQQHALRQGWTRTTDGVIDPFKKQGTVTSVTKMPYQLLALNAECLRIAFSNGQEKVHQQMIDFQQHAEGVYPQSLRNDLRVAQVML